MNARQCEYIQHALELYDADENNDEDAADIAMDRLECIERKFLRGEREKPNAILRAFYSGEMSREIVNNLCVQHES